MKALLISPDSRSVQSIDIENLGDIKRLIGYDTVISEPIGPENDCLFFDEECFLRGTAGRFQIDTAVPVSGRGVVVGSTDGGDTLRDVSSDEAGIVARLKFL